MSDLVAVNGAVTPTAPPKMAGNTKINITIKRTEHNIVIDMDKLTWKDAKALRKYQSAIADGTMTEDEQLAISDDLIRKVTGLEPDDMPMEVANRVMSVLFAEDADKAASEGN